MTLAVFTFAAPPIRIRFGYPAAVALPEEAAALGLERALVVAMPGARSVAEAARLAAALGPRVAATFRHARAHVPIETLGACIAAFEAGRGDGLVAIGGGSAIGLGKLVAAATGAPLIAVPTTYAGAEMTPFNAVTENGAKVQRRDPAMLPRCVVYDPGLTTTLPLRVSSASAMNAMAHAIEALYAPDTSPIVRLLALEALRLARGALPALVTALDDLEARAALLQAAMMAGQALAATSVALHHRLCHVLGGAHDLPHAELNAVILPYAIAYNAPGARPELGAIAEALGGGDPATAVLDLARRTGSPTSLEAIGVRAEDLDAAATTAAAQRYANPVPLERGAIRALLEDAFLGRGPPAGGYASVAAAA